MKIRLLLGCLCAFALAAQTPDPEALYKKACALCHDVRTAARVPPRDTLARMSPELVYESMVSGLMRDQGAALSDAEKRALAEHITRKKFGMAPVMTGACAANPPLTMDGPSWNGWGNGAANLRYQKDPGFTAEQLPKLKLKWAFGYPGAVIAYAQPAVVGGRVFVGSAARKVYSLDAQTGCWYWQFEATANVRTAVTVARVDNRLMAFFGDQRTIAYAVEAHTGKLVWKATADESPLVRITGAPAFHDGRLYVPLSTTEDGPSVNPKYECCVSSGGVVAMDARSGAKIWTTYTIQEKPAKQGRNAAGTQLWGPSGAAVWNAPTIDAKRKVLYVGTGDNHSHPTTKTSDALLALALDTGKIVWSQQFTAADAFNVSCVTPVKTNCPDPRGPDFDIGSSANLVTLRNGRDILVVGQKSGVVFGLDPDQQGKILWKTGVGRGGELGGIQWGTASDGANVYVAVSDIAFEDPEIKPGQRMVPDPKKGGGLFALQVLTGEKLWHTPAPPCPEGKKGCSPAQSAAVTAVPGVVFSGSVDGNLRAYSTRDGRILWTYDTHREFPTVNGVKAGGGSMDGPGPVVAGGMLFVNSGYGSWGGFPGNVLLAFGLE
jgi:polyvinyl alcohol dehydrogenase (cytochrome)